MKSLLPLAVILMFIPNSASSQAVITVPLKIQCGTTDSVVLHFGFDCNATRCLDTLLGERPLPPGPITGTFDARFVDPDGYNSDCTDQGLLNDFRFNMCAGLSDTFLIQLQRSGTTSNYVFSWPSPSSFGLWYCQLQDEFGGFLVNVDMLNDSVATVPTKLTSIYIYTQVCMECIPLSSGEKTDLPRDFELFDNVPNPFNPTTIIHYALPGTALVRLTVFDVLGREIAEPVKNEIQGPGRHDVTFDAQSLTSGVYYYRLVAVSPGNKLKSFVQVKKMLLLR